MAHGEKRTKAFDLAVREKLISSVGVSMHDRYNSFISVLIRENI
jgi:hypothetical protein